MLHKEKLADRTLVAIPPIFPAVPVPAKTSTSLEFFFQRRIRWLFGKAYKMPVLYETILGLSEMYETDSLRTSTFRTGLCNWAIYKFDLPVSWFRMRNSRLLKEPTAILMGWENIPTLLCSIKWSISGIIVWLTKSSCRRYSISFSSARLITAAGSWRSLFRTWSFRGRNFRIVFLASGLALFLQVFEFAKSPLLFSSFKYQLVKPTLRLLPTWPLSGNGITKEKDGSLVTFSNSSRIFDIACLVFFHGFSNMITTKNVTYLTVSLRAFKETTFGESWVRNLFSRRKQLPLFPYSSKIATQLISSIMSKSDSSLSIVADLLIK